MLPNYIQKLKRDGILKFFDDPYQYGYPVEADDKLQIDDPLYDPDSKVVNNPGENKEEDGLEHDTDTIVSVLQKYDRNNLGSVAVNDLNIIFKELGGIFGIFEILEAKKSFLSKVSGKTTSNKFRQEEANDQSRVAFEEILTWWNR